MGPPLRACFEQLLAVFRYPEERLRCSFPMVMGKQIEANEDRTTRH